MPLLQTIGNAASRAWRRYGPGSPGDYELISTTVVGAGGVASVTFSNLASLAANYKHLQVRIVARSNNIAVNTDNLVSRINSDTGSNYSQHSLSGSGSAVSSSAATSQAVLYVGDITGATGTTSAFGTHIFELFDIQSTTKYKTHRSFGGYSANANDIRLASGVRVSSSATTDLSFFALNGNLVQYSRFSLYGLRG
jgi:hypothetical protein